MSFLVYESLPLVAFPHAERADAWVCHLDVTGIPEDRLDMKLEGARFVVSGPRGDDVVTIRVDLPPGANLRSISAHVQDGALRLTVPKRPEVLIAEARGKLERATRVDEAPRQAERRRPTGSGPAVTTPRPTVS